VINEETIFLESMKKELSNGNMSKGLSEAAIIVDLSSHL
jgi:hypothetical protein